MLTHGTVQKVQAYDVDSKAVYNLVLYISNPEVRPLADENSGCNDIMIQQYFVEYFFMPGMTEKLAHSYGDRLTSPINQYDVVADLLKECPWTRRTVMVVPRPEDIDSEYPPCVRELQFFRTPPDYDVVWTTVFMRSWDVYAAGNPDLGSFQLAAEYIARRIGVPTGPMAVLATNAHIYRKSLEMIEKSRRTGQKRFAEKYLREWGKP